MSRICFGLLAVFAATCTWAADFNLNATFDDGAAVTGTFSTDATFSTITAWNITVSGSSDPLRNFAIASPSGAPSSSTE